MADILIRGMKMPKMPDHISQGMEIPFVNVRIFASGNAVVSKPVRPYYDEYKVFSLPEEHGRLIDADAIEYTYTTARGNDDGHNWRVFAVGQDEIDDMPTIVPAEGGGEK